MLRVTVQGARRCSQSLTVTVRRNLGLSTALAQKAQVDPIQQLFLDKIKEYKKQSDAGKPPGMTADVEKQLSDKLDNVSRLYNPRGEDFTKLPVFQFSEPTLDALGVEVQPSEEVADVMAEKVEEEEKYFFEP